MFHFTTLFIGMDVHKESFSLCYYDMMTNQFKHSTKVSPNVSYIVNYVNELRRLYGQDAEVLCGYEAGCLGFTLYHQLQAHGIPCIVMAPTTVMKEGSKRVKTDKKDAAQLAKALAFRSYQPVHIPTAEDEQVKEYIRMRTDHKVALKKIKQQILAFCLRHDFRYTEGSSNWTQKHVRWLRSLKPEGLYAEILTEYLLTYEKLVDQIERYDARIEQLGQSDSYQEKVSRLSCFIGIKTLTALSIVTEIGDFNRFATAQHFASYLGLTPSENSSGDKERRGAITKAGNSHVRRLLIEAAQSLAKGTIGYKSKELKRRQSGNRVEVIAYADKANERLRRRYRTLVLGKNKKQNVAKTAIARELSGFIWGMMTGRIA
ncbi:IS110 family transposase [Streptococcus suis]|uniref:IS110 family transposase n=3 Tax=Streptococcus suis TaxID=1307 RepID=UPI002AAB2CE9|nr:IS110 family transposase [Streptococcus suis]QZT28430.1 IS110 family transposase [Streptococcus suis]QZT28731.1 IS110 family transposase [Streptococcus suis]QZT28758.1 IS110 family transposase [Streptococcus suis]QZT28800.1 IS110 family transposase [Streptococcus suis]QZT29136.1 IS110 family transposase [Streptococcus suis]